MFRFHCSSELCDFALILGLLYKKEDAPWYLGPRYGIGPLEFLVFVAYVIGFMLIFWCFCKMIKSIHKDRKTIER